MKVGWTKEPDLSEYRATLSDFTHNRFLSVGIVTLDETSTVCVGKHGCKWKSISLGYKQ